ncbi:hydroxymethylglutaryl-coenzyme A reductase-domain-containing protein [Aspergillus navahoensis]
MLADTMRPLTPNTERSAPISIPHWLHSKTMLIPQKLSNLASAHPIHTVVLISLLVSSAYVALLEDSLLDPSLRAHESNALWLEPTQQLYAGPDTSWRWQDTVPTTASEVTVNSRAIVTLQFDHGSPVGIPISELPHHLVVEPIDPSLLGAKPDSVLSRLQSWSQSFSVAEGDVSEFLRMIQELPVKTHGASPGSADQLPSYRWVAKLQQGQPPRGVLGLAGDKWAEFVNLFQHADPMDVAVMAAAYTAMHLTFASLFISMYRLGSRFWLFASVLLSSTFAFVFALFAVVKLGIPVDLALLSEGLPFLVVVIGFENPIRLTRAVLMHAASMMPRASEQQPTVAPSLYIHAAIESSLAREGPRVLKHYAIEIAFLSAGALCGVDPPVRQFCFLSAWILFFDCVLLFSFYTAILCIKLEILRLPSKDRQFGAGSCRNELQSLKVDGPGVKRARILIRAFKAGMVATFILVNMLNVSLIPFRTRTSTVAGASGLSSWSAPRSTKHLSQMSGYLDSVLNEARLSNRAIAIALHSPVKLGLQSLPSVGVRADGDNSLPGFESSSLLKSLEDPVLLKALLVALLISLALNGKLFSAARNRPVDQNSLVHSASGHPPHLPAPPAEDERPYQPTGFNSLHGPSFVSSTIKRSVAECHQILVSGRPQELTDEEIITLSLRGQLPLHGLEKQLKDFTRAVKVRRSVISRTLAASNLTHALESSDLPFQDYDWSRVFGVCCENVVGYMPVPVGFAGPLVIDGQSYFLPMATTEGVLVAGVMRGSKAINAGGGVKTVLTADGMTRGPCVSFESLDRTAEAKQWLDSQTGQAVMKAAFDSTTRYGRLLSMKTAMAGTNLYIRFKASTGDAMGMNMISKGVEHALDVMRGHGFVDMAIVSLSANYCSDKKPAAINWIDGRGKSVVAQATIPPDIVRTVLKTDVDSLVALNSDKNLIGSAMAGSVGGFNAHAANIVAAMYIATGQDPAQVVESANCITIIKNIRGSLQISVSMPSIEVGTIGGGTTLGPQRAILDILGVGGANMEHPGENARRLARIIAAATLAGELSLCAALAAGHLVKAHMQHNRATQGNMDG